MRVYYLRLQPRAISGLDPNLHIQWTEFRSTFEKRVEKGELAFFLVADSNAKTFSCTDVNFNGTAGEIHILIPQIKKWAIFPIAPSVMFADAMKRGRPIKIFLTRYTNGRLGEWRLAILVTRRKLSNIYRLGLKNFRLGPNSFNDPTFEDNRELTIALKEKITGSGEKRKYRKISNPTSLPLPTSVPE
jgi:hypothetical protein